MYICTKSYICLQLDILNPENIAFQSNNQLLYRNKLET